MPSNAMRMRGNIKCAKDGTEFKLSDAANERFLGMGVNDAAHRGPLFIDLAVNGQFVRHLVLFAFVRSFAVKIHPSYRHRPSCTVPPPPPDFGSVSTFHLCQRSEH